ncbi:MAG: glycosyltransferase family 9 protein [Gemmatimonadales bacterium]|nr:glycosyltransferase family 9 protein [Gemmatimonadales bacterium]
MIEREIKRILLIRRRAMGDALVTLPAIAQVREAWPEARIDLVMDRPFATLLAGLLPGINILVFPPPPGSSWLHVLRSGRYDLVIDWLSNPRTALWTILTGAPLRVGYDLRRRWWAYNIRVARKREAGENLRSFAGENFLDPLRSLGFLPAPWRGGICAEQPPEYPSGAVRSSILRWIEEWNSRPGFRVAVVMSATWSAKAWPKCHIRKLIARMSAEGMNPVLVTGPGDEALAMALESDLEARYWAPATNLPELSRLLQSTELFVGTDCGVRHLAAGLGVPTVTLFGPTDPGNWNPTTPEHVSLHVGCDCSPCDLKTCPLPGHPCMSDLSPDMVMEGVSRSLARCETERTL